MKWIGKCTSFTGDKYRAIIIMDGEKSYRYTVFNDSKESKVVIEGVQTHLSNAKYKCMSTVKGSMSKDWNWKRGKLPPINCERCNKLFTPKIKSAKYCSKTCKNMAYRDRRIGLGYCIHCGKPKERDDVQRCNECLKKRGKLDDLLKLRLMFDKLSFDQRKDAIRYIENLLNKND